MNCFRSSPFSFFSPASLLHAFILFCWPGAAMANGVTSRLSTYNPSVRACKDVNMPDLLMVRDEVHVLAVA